MTFTDQQNRALRAKLSYRHVKTRQNNGTTIPYLEGWHAIAEANRIFGYDSWDRTTMSPRCLWRETQRGQTACFYSTKVRITVRAGGALIVREGIGTGFGRSPSVETAHEIALKAAETDATKRALATFGNPFGLALYDKDQGQVTKPSKPGLKTAKAEAGAAVEPGRLILRSGGQEQRFDDAEAFVTATLKAVTALGTIDVLYAFWDANLASLAALQRRTSGNGQDPVAAIVSALQGKARALGGFAEAQPIEVRTSGVAPGEAPEAPALAIPKEKRLRDKGHLAFVAGQPCLVCGRRPAQAHHLRFAQGRGMGLKVSDEFTVPVCNAHHDSVHRTGEERAWWARHGILDPLKFASRLWAASRQAGADAETLPLSPEDDPPAPPATPTVNGPAATS